jgi:PAS domain S-box-containing protein
MVTDQLRILILEDIQMDAELVEYELGRASIPFTAHWVDNREEFLVALESFQPDLILSDYTLPRFDGMTALQLAKERAPSVPFVIVTGSVNEETAVGCMKAGATDYLLKSNLARIGPAVEGALARARLREEQQRAERALRRSEANLRAIFSHSQQSFVLIERDGTILALNPIAEAWAERVLGRPVREGMSIRDFIPQAMPAFEAAIRGETGTLEQRIRDADGSERWFETSHAPVVDDRGVVIGACLNARDVSERKAGEQALRESEERYRDLFDNASDLVCMATTEGRFLYVNEAWQERMGYSDDEIRRLNLKDMIHPDTRDGFEVILRRVLAGETRNHVELLFSTRGGAPVSVEANLSCNFRQGMPATIRAICRDVTERKRVEDQLRRAERMQAAGRLAGGVAHEVNNMMTGVIGFSEFLLKTLDTNDARRDDVHQVIKAATRAADITRQLLAFTRQQVLRFEVLEINRVVNGIGGLLRRSLGAEHTLELALAGDAGQVRADGSQLEQVLINLVLNSRDALLGPGRVTISTRLVELDQVYAARHSEVEIPRGSYVMLAVSDTGSGMAPETRQQIFEPFFTTKPIGQGTGLGLSTVYGIVKQCGGFIWVYSEPGQGSTFKIYLPQVNAAATGSGELVTGALPLAGRETILVVEDEEVVRDLVTRGLREFGYTVLEAGNGKQAIALLETDKSPDVVVCDVVMPEMGGRELGHHLSLLIPETPILFVSGYTGEDVVQRGLLDPGAPFLQKPFTPLGLAQKLREMLDLRYASRRSGIPAPA